LEKWSVFLFFFLSVTTILFAQISTEIDKTAENAIRRLEEALNNSQNN